MNTEKLRQARYNPKSKIPLSNNIIENCRYGLSPHGFSLLMGLCQNIDFKEELFPEFYIEIAGLFKFFNIKTTNHKRYDLVREALDNISHNPLQIRSGRKNWTSIPWLAHAYDEDVSTQVEISFHPKVIPYLVEFKKQLGLKTIGYTGLTPDNFKTLKNEIAIWLYPFFKKWHRKDVHKPSIAVRSHQWLRQKTFTEKKYAKGCHFIQAINRAIKEINKKTDVQIMELSRENNTIYYDNRTIINVTFVISGNSLKEEKPQIKSIKTASNILMALYDQYDLVEEMTFVEKEKLRYTKDGFEKYCVDNECIITRIGDQYYICK